MFNEVKVEPKKLLCLPLTSLRQKASGLQPSLAWAKEASCCAFPPCASHSSQSLIPDSADSVTCQTCLFFDFLGSEAAGFFKDAGRFTTFTFEFINLRRPRTSNYVNLLCSAVTTSFALQNDGFLQLKSRSCSKGEPFPMATLRKWSVMILA